MTLEHRTGLGSRRCSVANHGRQAGEVVNIYSAQEKQDWSEERSRDGVCAVQSLRRRKKRTEKKASKVENIDVKRKVDSDIMVFLKIHVKNNAKRKMRLFSIRKTKDK